MNILVVSRSLPFHNVGGMENVAWDVAMGLAALGHRIHVLTTQLPEGRDFPPKSAPHDLLTVQFLPGTPPGLYSRQWWRASRDAFDVLRGRFYPDVIVSISAGAFSILPLLNGIPSVMQVHGTSLGEFFSKIRSAKPVAIATALKNLWHVPSDLSMYRKFTRLIAVGPAVQSALHHPLMRPFAIDAKIVVIPNGVDTDRFIPSLSKRTTLRQRLRIPDMAKVLIWISRLHRQKGTHVALEAFQRLPLENNWLVVVGDGPERSRLQKLAIKWGLADRVIFVGGVAPLGVSDFLAAADAFVFTSLRDEGLPLNVLEAMSCDLPCVISRSLLGTLGVDEGMSGILPVDPRDLQDVAAAIERSFVFPEGGWGTRDYALAYYSKQQMVRDYENLLQVIVN
jgi:glycosyltransferase involved in cell wall biosynthesis